MYCIFVVYVVEMERTTPEDVNGLVILHYIEVSLNKGLYCQLTS